MATRVYWITLRAVAEVLRLYIQRNQIGLQRNLTPAQYACVVALLNAVLECLSVLPRQTPVE